MKLTFLKRVLLVIFVAILVFITSSCGVRVDYPYLHDKEKITKIEIVEAYYPAANKEFQKTLVLIKDKEKFISELEKLVYTEAPSLFSFMVSPQGLDPEKGPSHIGIKISYEGGDYEIFDGYGKAEYLNGMYSSYAGRGQFDREAFDSFLSKYLKNVYTSYDFMGDVENISSIEIVELLKVDSDDISNTVSVEDEDGLKSCRGIPKLITPINDIEAFMSELSEIECTVYSHVSNRLKVGDIAIKISYANGEFELISQRAQHKEFNNSSTPNTTYEKYGCKEFNEGKFEQLIKKWSESNNFENQ